MTEDARVLRLLREHLDTEPTMAPAGLLATIATVIDRSPQRKPRFVLRGGLDGVRPVPRPRTLWLAVAGALILLALGASLLLPGFPWSNPSPPSTPTSTPTSTPHSSGPAPSVMVIEDATRYLELPQTQGIVEGAYTSRINPWVTFELYCKGPSCRDPFVGELCPPHVAVGIIELPHAKVCHDSVSVIRPDSVACGTADTHPGAATLATAMLADAELHAVDLGDLQSSSIPTDLFGATYFGRVIQVLGGPTRTGRDPADCNLLLDSSGVLPPVEIRSDTQTTIVLVDVGSSLFVVRGQVTALVGGSPNMFLQTHLLNLIHHITFVP